MYIDNPPPNYQAQARSKIRECSGVKSSLPTLFPIVTWLPKYNLTWLWSDFISGLTLGCIVVPQAMAYAQLAGLPPQFGLYNSFVGVVIYPFFGTSKDISIGTTAIQSLFQGQIYATVQAMPQFQSGQWTPELYAVTMSLFAGIITMILSVFRLGILFNFICQPAISGFLGGSALTIVISQLGKILGVHVSTFDLPYMIFGNTLKELPHASVDAVFGILSLVWLYGCKYACQYLARRYPRYKAGFSYFSMSRNVAVIIFTTFFSWLINHFGHYEKSPFTILGPVPAGFQNMGIPKLDMEFISHVYPNFPSMVVLLIMEHCSIAASMGQTSDYRINVNQEILTIGLSNIFGSFFTAYPATGSFCRTAVANKSGSKTPLYNILVAIIVVLALYALTPAFQYIPTASLAAVIAHAVTDLIIGPSIWRRLWNVHPSELLVFACAFLISLFARLDISIYVAVGLSIILQLYRTARPNYAIIGRMDENNAMQAYFSFTHPQLGQYVQPIAPGVIAFQPRENLVFENSLFMIEKIMDEIKATTRRGKSLAEKVGDRPWNEAESSIKNDKRPLLHAVIMDLTCVNQMDYSAIDYLKSVANQAERYAGKPVSWFFVVNDSIAVRRCLLFGGFGVQERKRNGPFRSDIKKRHNKEIQDDDSCSSGQQSVNDNDIQRNNKKEHIVEVEDIRQHQNHPAKKKSFLSYSTNSDNHQRLGNSHLDDVYPYFFFTMADAVVAACISNKVLETPAPSSSFSTHESNNNNNMNDEEKRIEKQ
ncbi:sulfate transporter family-domain-containing protein [Circinella umbellata]|nr:sulfate transporter family-domain-containing protein [Circinella umbellata]